MNETKNDTPPKPGFRERKLESGKAQPVAAGTAPRPEDMPKEIGGPAGPEPTRYGDWAFKGRVTDF